MNILARFSARTRWIAAGAVLAVLAGWGLTLRARAARADLGVLSEPLRKGDIVETVYGIGTVTARRSFQLRLGVTGTIRTLPVKEGDAVERGQTLVTIDNDTAFTAPFAGTVTYIPVKVGETVFAQAVIMSLVDLKDRYVVVTLDQRGAVRVHDGRKASLSFDSMRTAAYSGVVQAVYSNEGAFLVRIGVAGLPPEVLPGMTADVAISIGSPKRALLVPVAALGNGHVKVARGRGTALAAVQTGLVDGEMAEVTGGDLKEGDRVYLGKVGAP